MTLTELRSAAIDRALVGDDPTTALALAGAADIAVDASADSSADTPFSAAMLAVTWTAVDRDRPLDERAWRPGTDADSLVLAGAAAAVRLRDVSLDRAATLANATAEAVENAVKNRHRQKQR